MRQRGSVVYPSLGELILDSWHRLIISPVRVLAAAFSLFALAFTLVLLIPFGYLNAWVRGGESHFAWYQLFSRVIRAHLFIAGITTEVRHKSQLSGISQPLLLMANHGTYLDRMIILQALGDRYANAMAEPREPVAWPFSFWFRAMSAEESLSQVQVIFPELNPAVATDVVATAIRQSAPLVPVTISGMNRVNIAGVWLVLPGKIQVVVHSPVTMPDDADSAQDDELLTIITQQAMCAIAHDLPAHELSPAMISACRDQLALHPVTRAALGIKQRPRSQSGKRGRTRKN